MDKIQEQDTDNLIMKYIILRIKKGLGVNIIIVGPPGMGKSYMCLRISEIVYQSLFEEKMETGNNIVDNIPDAFEFVRKVKRAGEPLTIEEVSVIASSRRSMAADNVSLNYLMDTIRKKQIILLLNAPHIKGVDKHIQRMSHIMIECLRVNKRKEICTVKAFKLQTSQSTGKVYTHNFKAEGRDTHRFLFSKPSEQIINIYEKKKDDFQADLYRTMQYKALARKKKQMKEAGIKDTSMSAKPLTPLEIERFRKHTKDFSIRDIAKEESVSASAVMSSIQNARKKMGIKVLSPEKLAM